MDQRWKTAFFSLATFLCLLLIAFIVLLYMLFSDVETNQKKYTAHSIDGKTIFTVETTKERLNYLIQSQLEKLKYNRENVDFTVELDDKVNVKGSLNIFDRNVDFHMLLEPVVQDNGDLLLKQEGFYIGQLPVPSKQVLKFIQTSAKLPDWVIIQPNDGFIYIALNEIEASDDLRVKANTINLENDDISFEIYDAVENK